MFREGRHSQLWDLTLDTRQDGVSMNIHPLIINAAPLMHLQVHN